MRNWESITDVLDGQKFENSEFFKTKSISYNDSSLFLGDTIVFENQLHVIEEFVQDSVNFIFNIESFLF